MVRSAQRRAVVSWARVAYQLPERRASLRVVPAPLIANWRGEIVRFTPDLRVLVAHPGELGHDALATLDVARLGEVELVITAYAMLRRLAVLSEISWDLSILDEVQAINNPTVRQTRAACAVRARARVIMTGTPVENRLGDL